MVGHYVFRLYFLTHMLSLPIGRDDVAEREDKWHVYVTGHSLGGALATLLAIELASSQLAK